MYSLSVDVFTSGTTLCLAEANTWQLTQRNNGHHSGAEGREFIFIYEHKKKVIRFKKARKKKKKKVCVPKIHYSFLKEIALYYATTKYIPFCIYTHICSKVFENSHRSEINNPINNRILLTKFKIKSCIHHPNRRIQCMYVNI